MTEPESRTPGSEVLVGNGGGAGAPPFFPRESPRFRVKDPFFPFLTICVNNSASEIFYVLSSSSFFGIPLVAERGLRTAEGRGLIFPDSDSDSVEISEDFVLDSSSFFFRSFLGCSGSPDRNGFFTMVTDGVSVDSSEVSPESATGPESDISAGKAGICSSSRSSIGKRFGTTTSSNCCRDSFRH